MADLQQASRHARSVMKAEPSCSIARVLAPEGLESVRSDKWTAWLLRPACKHLVMFYMIAFHLVLKEMVSAPGPEEASTSDPERRVYAHVHQAVSKMLYLLSGEKIFLAAHSLSMHEINDKQAAN